MKHNLGLPLCWTPLVQLAWRGTLLTAVFVQAEAMGGATAVLQSNDQHLRVAVGHAWRALKA